LAPQAKSAAASGGPCELRGCRYGVMRRAGSFFLNRKLYISKSASAAVPFRVYHRNCTENAIIFA